MENKSMAISYLQIRKSVGYLGILLPIILMLYSFILGPCSEVQISLSQYYYTAAGNLFTGIICAISFFLYSYKGYDSKDNFAGTLASILGFATAFFPTGQKGLICNFEMSPYPFPDYFRHVHNGAAVLFFVVLAYFCLYLFTKSKENDDVENGVITEKPVKVTDEKKLRNKIYKGCGIIIIICLILLAINTFFEGIGNALAQYKPIFVFRNHNALGFWFFLVSERGGCF